MTVLLVIGKVKDAHIGGVLVGHTSAGIIGIVNIDLTLEILNGFEVAVRRISILQAVRIRVLHGGEVVPVISKGDGAAHAVGDSGDIAVRVVAEGEAVHTVGDACHLRAIVGKHKGVAAQGGDAGQHRILVKGVGRVGHGVFQRVAAAIPSERPVTAGAVFAIKVHVEIQYTVFG